MARIASGVTAARSATANSWTGWSTSIASRKFVKGGRRFGFAALVVVGDQKGRVGYGHGKAREVPEAIRKATEAAKRSLIRVPCAKAARCITTCAAGTGPAKSCCARRRPGPASSPVDRCVAVFETLGMHDVVAKSQGSSNPYNMIRATFDALTQEDSPRPGRGAPQHQGLHAAVAPPGRRCGCGRFLSGEMDMGNDMKKVTLEQIGSPIGRPAEQRGTLIGLRLRQDRPPCALEDTPAVRGMIAEVAHLVRIVEGQRILTMKLDGISDHPGASKARIVSAAASARARARPAAAASRARRHAPACG